MKHNGNLEMLELARKNKLLDLYLEHVLKPSKDSYISRLMVERERRGRLFHEALANTAKWLNEAGVEYALFKTLKPFRFLPNDIDILIFDMENLGRAEATLTEAGYVLDEYEPYVVSLVSPEGVIVELHHEIPISYFVYLDKLLLKPYISSVNIDDVRGYTLKPCAELLCTIAHSLFKENMMTLAEYMDIRTRVDRQLSGSLEEFRGLVEKSNMELGVYLMLKIVLSLEGGFLSKHKWYPMKCLCEEMRSSLTYADIADSFIVRLIDKPIFPHKFHPVILTLLFIDRIIKDDKARSSLASQVFNTLDITNPYTRKFGWLLIDHFKREGY